MNNRSLPVDSWHYRDPEASGHVIFKTKPCNWYKCGMCSLPSYSSDKVTFPDIIKQIDFFCETQLDELQRQLNDEAIEVMTIGNNGSILDTNTFPLSALFYLLARLRLKLPHMKKLGLVTEPQYVTDKIMYCLMDEFISWTNDKNREKNFEEIEIAVGLETVAEKSRKWINKRFGIKQIESLFNRMSLANSHDQNEEALALPQFSFKAYILLKPVPLSNEEAIEDVKNCIKLVAELGETYGIKTITHINPMYVAKGSPIERAIKQGIIHFTPPDTTTIAKALLAAKPYWTDKNRFCLGLSDEGLAVEGGSFIPTETDPLWTALNSFNHQSGQNMETAFSNLEQLLSE